MSGDVADHDARRTLAKLEQLIEVPTYALGRDHSSRGLCLRRHDVCRWKELHLQVVREIHLLQQALTVE